MDYDQPATIDPRQLASGGGGSGGGGGGHGLQMDGLPPQASSQARHLRVPTVHDALAYTPFSSIVPFNPEIMAPPLALPTTYAAAFDTDDAVKTARRELERLSAGAASAEQASKRCTKTLRDVQKLLDPDIIAEFKFKKTKRIARNETSKPLAGKAPSQPALSAFAKMVHNDHKVTFKYMNSESSETPQPKPRPKGQQVAPHNHATNAVRPATDSGQATPQLKQGQTSQKQKFAPSQPPSKQSPAQSVQKSTPVPLIPMTSRPPQAIQAQYTPQFQQNGLDIPISKQVSPQTTPSGSSKTKLCVKPAILTQAQRAEFQLINDNTPSRNQSAYLTHGDRSGSTDQRYKADLALDALQTQLQNIFEAEDQMQPDTSGDEPTGGSDLFMTRDTEDGPALVLQYDAQLKLHVAFEKVVTYGRLSSVESDLLVRVQRICERSLAALNSGTLSIGDDWIAEDTNDWLSRISSAENGLVAVRTLLAIMTGGSERKELQSEDCLMKSLNAMRIVVETCIIPIVEERSYIGERIKGEKGVPTNPKFDIAVQNRKTLQSLVQIAAKSLRLLGKFFESGDVDETGVSSLEYLCKVLIFAENASNEKDSALGIQSFEGMRKFAMDVMAKIFSNYDGQRSFIVDEILLSLEKLPANKQSARQYHTQEGKRIQLVSALFMRLVQTSATPNERALSKKDHIGDSEDDEDSEDPDASETSEDEIRVGSSKKPRKSKSSKRAADLASVYKPLQGDSMRHARYIVNSLLQRSVGRAKQGDDPFRKLLDIFTDDFINVLGSSDWPAAELMLRHLAIRMITFAQNKKSPAPHRTLALELLGTIGSAILDIQAAVADGANALDDNDEISKRLANLAKGTADGKLDMRAVVDFEGPFRVVIEYLHARNLNDPQLLTARGYHLVQWAEQIFNAEEEKRPDGEPPFRSESLKVNLLHMMEDRNWLEDFSQYPNLTSLQGKLAAKLVTANTLLFRLFTQMFGIVLSSMSSEQPTVRSRALKSVTILLEKDPAVLERNPTVLKQIMRSLSDSSSLVRDSALMLIQKCVSLRPGLELQVYERVVERTTDTAVSVRKRAMAFLKQIYLDVNNNHVRAQISNAMISRIHDIDESVTDNARAIIEEIWFSSFRNLKPEGERSVDVKIELAAHAALIIQTVNLGDNVAAVLEALLKTLLTKSKQAAQNLKICKAFVGVLFDGIIEPKEIPGSPSQTSILQTLTVFSKAAPILFKSSQLEVLEPYTKNLTTSDDLEVYHFVITILRYTMPVLSGIKAEFLRSLQDDLLRAVGKLPKSELEVVAPCLWTIDSVLNNTNRLVGFMSSALKGVSAMQKMQPIEGNAISKINKLMTIIGQFGKACNLNQFLATFKADSQLSWFKGNSVDNLMVELCCKFTSPKQPIQVRETALEAVCAISHSFPGNFMREDVKSAFALIFKGQERSLEKVLLFNLEVFFQSGETQHDDADTPDLGSGIASGTRRLGGTYLATGYDMASIFVAQTYLADYLRIGLSSLDEVSLSAARIMASINRQGVDNPGKSAPGLVALQTCPNTAIAKTAYISHKDAWTKHETSLEKTIMASVEEAFRYQKDVVKSPAGAAGHPPVSKLHYFWDVLKGGKPKARTKFFTSICAAVNFSTAKMTTIDKLSQHLLFVRFCVEGVAFLDFDNSGELMNLLSSLDQVFDGTGTGVAQSIDTEIMNLQVPVASSQMPVTSGTMGDSSDNINVGRPAAAAVPAIPPIDPVRLQQLTLSAQILALVGETRSFLRRVWNMKKKEANKKLAAKELNTKPNRATSAPAMTNAYQNRINQIMNTASDQEAQRDMCGHFSEMLSVDNEVKVGSDEDDGMELDRDDDTRSEGSASKSPAPKGKKRKSTDRQSGPPKKKGRPTKSSFAKTMDDDEDEEGGWG